MPFGNYYGLRGVKLNIAIAVVAGTDFALFGKCRFVRGITLLRAPSLHTTVSMLTREASVFRLRSGTNLTPGSISQQRFVVDRVFRVCWAGFLPYHVSSINFP